MLTAGTMVKYFDLFSVIMKYINNVHMYNPQVSGFPTVPCTQLATERPSGWASYVTEKMDYVTTDVNMTLLHVDGMCMYSQNILKHIVMHNTHVCTLDYAHRHPCARLEFH
jgi:hypothetical protein